MIQSRHSIPGLTPYRNSRKSQEPPASVEPSAIARRTKIIGGDDVGPGVYPWFAGGVYNNYVGIGGSLVAPEYVLTSADSINYYDYLHGTDSFKNNGRFMIGLLCNRVWDSVKNCGQEYEVFGVTSITLHPGFDKNGTSHPYQDDIALVRLDGRSKIKPVKMDPGFTSDNYENEDPIGDLFSIGKTQMCSTNEISFICNEILSNDINGVMMYLQASGQ